MQKLLLLSFILLINPSCQKVETELTEEQRQDITQSVTELVGKVFDYSNNMDFETGLDHYAQTSHSYFVMDGQMHSLAELKKAYKAVGPSVEALHNTIESWNVHVLSANTATVTLPVRLMLKLKGIPEFTGQLVWTATLYKQDGRWMIVQSHESWLNCADVAAALAVK